MPSTYSTSLKLELIGNGEQAGAWGTTTNNNLGTLIEQAVTGVLPLTIYGDTTLTNYNGLSDQARNAVLFLTGNLTASANVVAPAGQQKVYIVRNRTGNTVNLTTGSGTNVSIANAASEVVFTDGTNFYSATQFNYINGNLTVTGNETVGGSITLGGDLYGNSGTGQFYLPAGNTAQRTSSPIVGSIRYNSEGQFYEGYTNVAWVRFTVAPEGNYTLTYAIVAGGAGGGGNAGGGGGAGGLLQNTLVATPGTLYTFSIGAGGSASTNGTNSYILGVATATGGGAGGSAGPSNGASGGSGGGGSSFGNTSGGAGIPGQGNTGGGSNSNGAGGGGGASAAGATGSSPTGGAGGAGTALTITGTTVYASGGGGGAVEYYQSGSGGAGGVGGGGAGGATNVSGTNGTINTGGGGGGGGAGGGPSGGSGGSGCIYISMPTVSFSGVYTGLPTVTTYGSTTVLRYTNSGTYTA
jgi:hypothetical protein